MGTRTATGEVKLSLQATIKNTGTQGEVASATLGDTGLVNLKFTSGINANQANRAWQNKKLTILSGNTIDLDLYDLVGQDTGFGSGRDALGQTQTFEEIMTFAIKQLSTSTGRCEIMPTDPGQRVLWIPVGAYVLAVNDAALKNEEVYFRHRPHTDAFDLQDGVAHKLRLGAVAGDVDLFIGFIGRHDDEESSSSSSSSSTTSTLSTLSTVSSSTASSQSSSSSTSTLSTQSSSSTSTLSTSSTLSSLSTSTT